jgi:endonuclease/exonuclease/phosphatase family metal-dependent hydrolase
MYHTKYLYPLLANWHLFLNKICGVSYHTAQHKFLRKIGKGTNNIILGDWNSVVGDKAYRNIVGSYGQGTRNHRAQMVIDFCERNRLIVTNTWFKTCKRRLYTWKVPGDWSWHQLDYLLMKHRLINNVKDVQTLPGADIDCDHNLLVTKFCTRLKKIMIPKEKT